MTSAAPPILPVIVGPTASGKSALGVSICRALAEAGGAGEIISADSMQIYRGLDIGSAKPTDAERAGVTHHLIDVCEPSDAFTVHDWLNSADRAIGSVRGRSAVPVVVGGTHLYVKALLDGLFDGPAADAEIREKLAALGRTERRALLSRVDPEAAQRIHPNDDRRTIRALEVHEITGAPISALQREWDEAGARRGVQLIAFNWPTEQLNQRINARVRRMLDDGLLEEVRRLHDRGVLTGQSAEGLGYKQLLGHLNGACSLEEAVERIKIETRRFAKNQRTWIRRLVGERTRLSGEYPGVHPPPRVIGSDGGAVEEIAQAVALQCLG